MKLRFTFKTPDILDDTLNTTYGEDDGDDEQRCEDRAAAKAVCEQFIRDGEFVTVEIDTETQQATVLPASRRR